MNTLSDWPPVTVLLGLPLVGIYTALHILLPDDLADRWVTQSNDNLLFRGQAPIDYMVSSGLGQNR
jgi:hypothetical protein